MCTPLVDARDQDAHSMSDAPPSADARPEVVTPQKRQVFRPGGAMERRGGLVLLGLGLVIAASVGFWFVLESVDSRQEYLIAVRAIERFEVVGPAHFATANANLGPVPGLTPEFAGALYGQWAVSRIPAGTLVVPALFERPPPPLSQRADSELVLIDIDLPAGEAPYETLAEGDTIALIGAEGEGVTTPGLIGVLTLELVQKEKAYYEVTPAEALEIENIMSRFDLASERRVWKIGGAVTAEDLAEALRGAGSDVLPSAPNDLSDLGPLGDPLADLGILPELESLEPDQGDGELPPADQ